MARKAFGKAALDDVVERALSSGAVDLESFGDTYLLSKMLLCILAKEVGEGHNPLCTSHREEMVNLHARMPSRRW
jgi:hypothetical protein